MFPARAAANVRRRVSLAAGVSGGLSELAVAHVVEVRVDAVGLAVGTALAAPVGEVLPRCGRGWGVLRCCVTLAPRGGGNHTAPARVHAHSHTRTDAHSHIRTLPHSHIRTLPHRHYTLAHSHIRTHALSHIRTHAHSHIRTHAYADTDTDPYPCVCASACACMCRMPHASSRMPHAACRMPRMLIIILLPVYSYSCSYTR